MLKHVVAEHRVVRELGIVFLECGLDVTDEDLIEDLTGPRRLGPGVLDADEPVAPPERRSSAPTPPAPQPTSSTRPKGRGSCAIRSARGFSK